MESYSNLGLSSQIITEMPLPRLCFIIIIIIIIIIYVLATAEV